MYDTTPRYPLVFIDELRSSYTLFQFFVYLCKRNTKKIIIYSYFEFCNQTANRDVVWLIHLVYVFFPDIFPRNFNTNLSQLIVVFEYFLLSNYRGEKIYRKKTQINIIISHKNRSKEDKSGLHFLLSYKDGKQSAVIYHL